MSNEAVLDLVPVAERPAAPQPSAALALPQNSPAGMMLAAMAQGASLEQVEKMMDLQDRWEKREAEKAFNQAMADFKGEAVEIIKRKQVDYPSSKGGRVNYKHAELADVIDAAAPALSKHGFSWSWKAKQDRGFIEVACILKHKQGHSESVTLTGPYDDSGGKNAIQAIISAKTYLERHTLKAVCGLAEKSEDDDGAGAGNPAQTTAQDEARETELQAGREAAMKGMEALLAWWGNLDGKARGKLQRDYPGLRKAAETADTGAAGG
ncbi:ERF family protein [uncultured Ramlibacter sp.]|uniref:ERF family protein n=1 Tax=uncultured Ramlibacter sp. TaxID=260755 RepID=UPI00261DCDB8|nr:ERF family protein [uncultured Ramlibacter sp.]